MKPYSLLLLRGHEEDTEAQRFFSSSLCNNSILFKKFPYFYPNSISREIKKTAALLSYIWEDFFVFKKES